MKLKTLNEIQTEEMMADYFKDVISFDVRRITRVVKGGLKQEGINHIKYIEKNYLKENINNSIYERGLISRGKIDWIKYFFNISEEDLK